jgi:hypothetical protein
MNRNNQSSLPVLPVLPALSKACPELVEGSYVEGSETKDLAIEPKIIARRPKADAAISNVVQKSEKKHNSFDFHALI